MFDIPIWRRWIAHRSLNLAFLIGAGVSWFFYSMQIDLSTPARLLGYGLVYFVFLLLNANTFQLEQLKINDAIPASYPYPLALRRSLADTLSALLIFCFLAFSDRQIEAWVVAAAMVAMFIVHFYIAPILTLSTLIRRPDLEAKLSGFAPDLVQRAENMNCPIYVRDPISSPGLDLGEDGDDIPVNASAYGFGRMHCIVLHAEVVENLPIAVNRGLLAHEIAHVQLNHVAKELVGLAIPWLALIALAHFGEVNTLWLAVSFGFLFVPSTWQSRRHEFQADRLAANWIGVDTMIETIESLPADNREDNMKDAIRRSHLTHVVRIAALQFGQPLKPAPARDNDPANSPSTD